MSGCRLKKTGACLRVRTAGRKSSRDLLPGSLTGVRRWSGSGRGNKFFKSALL